MKAFAIIRMSNGLPDIGKLSVKGAALCAQTPNGQWGIYILTGTAAELQAINALPQVYTLCTVTAPPSQPRWPELEDVIPLARRTRINEWLSARGYPTIPAGWTYRQAITAICQPLNDHYEITSTDVLE